MIFYVTNNARPVVVFYIYFLVHHLCICAECRVIVFEYLRGSVQCLQSKAEVKIYRYNKTLAATDNHRPFTRIGHDNDDHDGGDGDDDDVGGGDFRNKRQ